MTIRVPYLPQETIENDAEALLADFTHSRGVRLEPPIPLEDIVEKHLKLRVEFDDLHQILGVPQTGLEPDIIGAIWVDQREIFLHQSLDPEEQPNIEGRYRFTLAHEAGGHWRLHQAYLASDANQASLIADLTSPAVVCRTSQAKERIEWQADFYASCLLMPRSLVLDLWQRRFGGIEPLIYETLRQSMHIDPPRRRWPTPIGRTEKTNGYDDFADSWANYFAPMFLVSRQAMRIRLETLGLLCREVPKQSSFARMA